MFIVWGTKVVRTPLGVVADFCPLCRSPQAFRLVRVGMASHVYYLSFGKGKLAGFERTCLQCRTVLAAEHDDYKGTAKKYPFPHMGDGSQMSHLITQTYPQLREQYAARLDLEDDLARQRAQLDVDQRHRMIREPFLLLGPSVERRDAQNQFDAPTLLTLLVGAGLVVLALVIADQVLREYDPTLVPLIGVGAVILLIVAIVVQLHLAKGRHLRRHVLPVLGKALRPLRPDATEISSVLNELQRMELKLGKRIKPQLLRQYL